MSCLYATPVTSRLREVRAREVLVRLFQIAALRSSQQLLKDDPPHAPARPVRVSGELLTGELRNAVKFS